jgi:hypothetical protein
MRNGISASLFLFVFFAWGCSPRAITVDGADTASVSKFVGFVVKSKTLFKKSPVESSLLKADEKCELAAGAKIATKDSPVWESKHYKATVVSDEFKCGFQTGYVFSEHVTASHSSDSSFCSKSWEEAPGTTDYTTFDEYRKAAYSKPDRPQNKTLIGSGVQRNRSLCEKARALKPCFVRTVLEADNNSAKKFRAWAASRGINPMLALMAKTERETKLGSIPDSCVGRSCNGIGIGQIIDAFDESGKKLSDSDPRWEGITFNILTNLTYSVRVLAVKTGMSRDLYDLAYYYNGSSGAAPYASAVVGFYNQLKGCGL